MYSRWLAVTALFLLTALCPLTYAAGASNPHINSVTQVWPRSFQFIEISGYGFGTHAKFDGDSQFIAITDISQGWGAGHTGDAVTIYLTSWTDKLITIEYFDGAYGTGNYSLVAGDKLSIEVWNPQTGQGPGKAQVTVLTNATALYNFGPFSVVPSDPVGPLTVDAQGNYYGNAQGGPELCNNYYTCGSVYELSPQGGGTWSATDLYSFTGNATGARPVGSLVRDAAGNLYGAASWGGSTACSFGCGLVFEISGGAETVLHTFQSGSGDGLEPNAGLTMDSQGNLWGTTSYGGATNHGTVYELTPNGTGGWNYATVYSFQGGASGDGDGPWSDLTLGADGNLYGTTANGGTLEFCDNNAFNGCGTVYEIVLSPSGFVSERVLHVFQDYTLGVQPRTAVTFDKGGNLYGVTQSGGPYCGYRCSAGVAYVLYPQSNGTWKQNITFDFSNNVGNIDAAINPTSQLTYYKGVLYGYAGNGASEGGTIYTLTQSGLTWTQSTIYSFGVYPDGWNPSGRPIFGADGTIYGVTFYGGLNGYGVFYSLPPGGLSSVSRRLDSGNNR